MMDFRSRKVLSVAGSAVLVLVLAATLLHHRTGRPIVDEASMADAAPSQTAATPPPPAQPESVTGTPHAICLRRGITVSLGQASFHVPGPPALTLVTGNGVDDEINFAIRAGLDKACAFPTVTARAIALDFDAMDKKFGAAADWRKEFCGDKADGVTRYLCQGDDRAKGVPRRLALATIYDSKAFDGEATSQQKAPSLANFGAWKDVLVKAGTPPPVQADGDFDLYPGGIWLERDAKGQPPFLFSCDVDGWPVSGQHYCIGSLDLDQGLHARIEFRTTTAQVGAEAADAVAHLKALVAAWH
jgi:hypothetical protein